MLILIAAVLSCSCAIALTALLSFMIPKNHYFSDMVTIKIYPISPAAGDIQVTEIHEGAIFIAIRDIGGEAIIAKVDDTAQTGTTTVRGYRQGDDMSSETGSFIGAAHDAQGNLIYIFA